MNAIKSALAEPIRKTMLDHVVIVTVRSDDPFLLRPFATFTLNAVSGEVSPAMNFATEIAALAAHDAMIRTRR